MANFETEGLDELEQQFRQGDEAAGKLLEEIVNAQTDIVLKAQQDEIASMLYDTGGFQKSLKAGNIVHTATECYREIQPDGRAPHTADYGGGGNKRKGKSQKGNVRYATIGWIYEYGTSSIAARPWLTSANAKAEPEAQEKAQEIWNEKSVGQ